MIKRMIGLKSLPALALLALLLAGCLESTATTIHPPLMLPTRLAEYEVRQVDIAVGQDGTKYMAWAEFLKVDIGPYNCKTYVTWTKAGEMPTVLQVQPVTSDPEECNAYPDIAVIYGHQVYLVWRRWLDNSYQDCWAAINPAHPQPVTCQALNTTSYVQTIHSDGPRVAAGDTDVYAVYGVTLPTSPHTVTALRFRRLSEPGTPFEGWVNANGASETANAHVAPAIAVSRAGRLYVAWLKKMTQPGAPPLAYQAACIDPTAITYPKPAFLFDQNMFSDHRPVIRISPDESQVVAAFVSGEEHPLTHKEYTPLHVIRYDSACSLDGVFGSDLPVTEYWAIQGRPSIAFSMQEEEDQAVYTAFAATNPSVSGDTEIFYKPFTGSPTRLTDNAWDDLNPVLVQLQEEGQNRFALAWRTRTSYGFEDVYLSKLVGLTSERVFHGRSAYDDLVVESNGQTWAGGVWISQETDTSTRHMAWMTFNDWEFYIPQVKK